MRLSSDFEEAVDHVEESGKRTYLFLRNTLNDHGYRKLENSLDETEEVLEGIEPDSRYEGIVLDDMEAFIEVNREYADFMRRDSDKQVDEMFDFMYGDGALERLESEARNYDEEAEYRAAEMSEEIITDDPAKYRSELEQIMYSITNSIERYAKEEGLMPEEFDFETQVIPPNKPQRASWNPQINQLNMPLESGFGVIRESGGVQVDATNAIFTGFHELVGHGVHQWNSSGLEYPKFRENTWYSPASNAHSEGIAQNREELAREFIGEERNDLPVLDIGLDLRGLGRNTDSERKIYTRLVREMHERDEVSEEEAKEMVGRVYKPELAERALSQTDMGLMKAFNEGCYSAGRKLMNDIDAENRSTASITTGHWMPQTLPEAVDYLESKK